MEEINACDFYSAPGFESVQSFIITAGKERTYAVDHSFVAAVNTEDNKLNVVFEILPGFEDFLQLLVQMPELDELDLEIVWRCVSGTATINFNVFACNLEYSWAENNKLYGCVVFESEDPNFRIQFDVAPHARRVYFTEV